MTWYRCPAVQENAKVNEERLKKEIDDLRGKLLRTSEDMSTNTQTMKMAMMDQADRY